MFSINIMIVIIVLGRKLNKKNEPTEILLERMEDAVAWYKWLSGFDKDTVLLLSGGPRTNFSKTTEASVMKRIAKKLGVPSNKIILEDASTTTIENALFVKQLLDSLDFDYDDICLVTSDFHMKRSLYIFRDIVDPEIFSLVSKYDPYFEKGKEVYELMKYKKIRNSKN